MKILSISLPAACEAANILVCARSTQIAGVFRIVFGGKNEDDAHEHSWFNRVSTMKGLAGSQQLPAEAYV
jgi:hypothetical protein